MIFSLRPMWLALVAAILPFSSHAQTDHAFAIPDPLKPWAEWATWDAKHQACPTPYNDPKKHFCFWPSELALRIDGGDGSFEIQIAVFSETWVPLPGNRDIWPLNVTVDAAPVPVVEREGRPAVRLNAGTHRVAGEFRWSEMPQSLPLPRETGVVRLTLEGQPVEIPAWNAEGLLWLRRDGPAAEAEKDFMSVKVYSIIEDGIPLWLRTEVELVVSGKSREEEIGNVLPEGWKLSAVQSQIPVAVDDMGRMKAQVRAGKWVIHIDAFRLDDPREIRYAAGVEPAVEEQLLGFRSKPDFRMVEIIGIPAIDVSLTTFPDKWRELPVYRWETGQAFEMEERMRGMGAQRPAGLTIAREWWLDDDGSAFTFRDSISGARQEIWRLNAASGQDLGSVRSDGEGQLITRGPDTGAPGVEIRSRNLDLEATGRMKRMGALPATGWQSDADDLRVTLNLPPGWRLFALFGADWVHGDWLTAWTLLDLFLLLIFSFAVFRLWGAGPAVLAFLAFAISYHESDAPRYVWLVLLMPLALLQVVTGGWGRRLLQIWKWVTIAALVVLLVPFVVSQVQEAIYPQLGDDRAHGGIVTMSGISSAREYSDGWSRSSVAKAAPTQQAEMKSNLLYDAKARIQTGPGVPEWTWRTVSFGWNGPVAASQDVRLVLIPRGLERFLAVARVLLLLALAAMLLDARRWRGRIFGGGAAAASVFLSVLAFGAAPAAAQIPDKEMLDTLRNRLLESSDAYPNAADIPAVTLKIDGRRLVMEAEIHTAVEVAVPLPGRLPAWSPLSVSVDDRPEATLRREDGHLWIVLPAGVHDVRVEGVLADVTEWEWTFKLKPRRVTVEAPGWNVSGIRPNGVPEQQIFFSRQQRAEAGEASYDRQDFQAVALVERHLELGLIWQARTTVKRLSPTGKAISLRVPLLPGENVISTSALVEGGFVEVRLGAQEKTFTWESEVSQVNELVLATEAGTPWVEQWQMVVSPVWNVEIEGLAPTFEPENPQLVPVWRPWPGEEVALTISRPQAVAGATITVRSGTHEVQLGKRQRVSKLDLSVLCSLGEDFLIGLASEAEITSLTRNGENIPVRKDGRSVIVPVRPGEQAISLGWKIDVPLGVKAAAEPVTLPVESANITTSVHVPDDRWILWTFGPMRGPAVRFWVVLVCALLAALVLARLALSPLRSFEWFLLAIGLTQVSLPAAVVVIGWLFLLSWRGRETFQILPKAGYNLLQVLLIGLTAAALIILVAVVAAGLLGSPEMFIAGNGSTRSVLRWYLARSDASLPQPGCFSISIWWYRFLMLAWALWLAVALIRWLRWGWEQFSEGGCFRPIDRKKKPGPPPIPQAG